MGSYRDAYRSGGASASAAYHYSGGRRDDPLMNGERGRCIALPANGSVYGYNTSAAFALRNKDLLGGGLLSEFHSLTQYHDSGVSGVARSHWGRPTATYSQTLVTDSRGLGSDVWPSHGQSLYPGVHFSRLLSSRTSTDTFTSSPHAFVRNALQPPGSSQALDSVAGRKRKTPSLDALIKETWELHSLFRAGLVADSKKTKRSVNGLDDIRPTLENEMHTTNDGLDIGGIWEEKPSLEMETPPRSWKELDASLKERQETFSNNKQKDSSLLMDMKQEQYASSVQRSLCKRVTKFMGDSSDDQDSDEESFVDSDDGVLNVYESSHNIKGREEQAYEFFLQMFEENKDLQKLYNEQCHVGKFECLVCSSIPGKPSKKYNGLISVIMHASKIIKTKKKQEHRGYARAVCSAMGWDICRLPTMCLGSSPNPRCCIPADEEENTAGDKIEEASKERDESGALNNSQLSPTSEESSGEEHEF